MKEYNPQGGSISRTSLPRVASYRRQPWAIESTTPVGLPYYYPLIIMPPRVTSSHHPMGLHISLPIYHNHNHGDEDNITVEFAHHCPFIITPRHRDGARHGHLL